MSNRTLTLTFSLTLTRRIFKLEKLYRVETLKFASVYNINLGILIVIFRPSKSKVSYQNFGIFKLLMTNKYPTIFLANAMEIPWLDLLQYPCHV